MRCVDCPHMTRPFTYCSKLKQPLVYGKTVILGCNIDGKMDWMEDERDES